MKVTGRIESDIAEAFNIDAQSAIVVHQVGEGMDAVFHAHVYAERNQELLAALEALFISVMAADKAGEHLLMAAFVGSLERIEQNLLGEFIFTDKDGKKSTEPIFSKDKKPPDMGPSAN